MSDPLQLHRDGPVARLRMTRAEVHNAFDAALIAGLTAALDEVAADAAIRVLVLEAEGASFSAGA
ncbi:MAG TPA: enoyl-CoA hydratase-related protein, partial [Thermomonas sp.]|nr:enoyl-CoA hydratase-related protein [Thermomonas sp.]